MESSQSRLAGVATRHTSPAPEDSGQRRDNASLTGCPFNPAVIDLVEEYAAHLDVGYINFIVRGETDRRLLCRVLERFYVTRFKLSQSIASIAKFRHSSLSDADAFSLQQQIRTFANQNTNNLRLNLWAILYYPSLDKQSEE